jgi:hypothetical protein
MSEALGLQEKSLCEAIDSKSWLRKKVSCLRDDNDVKVKIFHVGSFSNNWMSTTYGWIDPFFACTHAIALVSEPRLQF